VPVTHFLPSPFNLPTACANAHALGGKFRHLGFYLLAVKAKAQAKGCRWTAIKSTRAEILSISYFSAGQVHVSPVNRD
jgi:hypothetical protein